MYFQFGVPLALTFIALGFVALMFGLQKLLAPNNPYPRKLIPYECGEPPTGKAWINFNVRFYLIALIFVIFEVEVAFIYPIAAVYLDWIKRGQRLYVLGEILVFLGILFVGLIYVWAKHDLEWIKKVPVESPQESQQDVAA
jgi:NADH-quinone oxidoreductase subunit A